MTTVKLEYYKACKNSKVYKCNQENAPITSVYLMNKACDELGNPKSIKITIDKA